MTTPASALIEEIRANIESSDGVVRERYLASLLSPFKQISDLMYPEKSVLSKFTQRKNKLMSHIRAWNKSTDRKEAEQQIATCRLKIEDEDKKHQRYVFISKRLWDLYHRSDSDARYKNSYALQVFARFLGLMWMYADRLDALLLEYFIDIMAIQKEAGIWIYTRRDLTMLESYCGSLQLAKKYIDRLPTIEVKPSCRFNSAFDILQLKGLFDELLNKGYIADDTDEDSFIWAFGGDVEVIEYRPIEWTKPVSTTHGQNISTMSLLDLMKIIGIPQKEIENKSLHKKIFARKGNRSRRGRDYRSARTGKA